MRELAHELSFDPSLARHVIAIDHDYASPDREVIERRPHGFEIAAQSRMIRLLAVRPMKAKLRHVEIRSGLGAIAAQNFKLAGFAKAADDLMT